MKNLIYILCLAVLSSCSMKNKKANELEKVAHLMTGVFSSAEQAEMDSAFYSINLVMTPIWEDDKEARWLYVEQAVSSMLDRPYRQRVYKLTHADDGSIESKVFALSDTEKYINSWNTPEIFNAITPDSLVVREGCSVFLKKGTDGCYTGSTVDDLCKSTLRGAAYATSIVTVCPDKVISWDQGWNDAGEQVWGAVKAGYIFKKIKEGQKATP